MVTRPCLDCRRLFPGSGTRCPDCRTVLPGLGRRRWRDLATAVVAANPQCSYCGTAGTAGNPLGVDHVVPRAAGGTDNPSNLATCCRRCNSAKGAR